jgi:hypothetical protein
MGFRASKEEDLKKPLLACGLIAIAALCAAAPLAAQSAGTLEEISLTQEGGKTVILIKVDGRFTYETSSLTLPRRLVIDLTPVDKITVPPLLQVGSSGILSIRAGQFKPLTARIVIDLDDRNPAQSIGAVGNGLKISFWLEGAAAAPAVTGQTRPQPVREFPRGEVKNNGRLKFFFRAGAGVGLFLKPELTAHREFSLYGETGAFDETYTFKNGLAIDVGFGKYLRLGGSRLKAGIVLTSWQLPNEGSFAMTLPHPFQANAPRTVAFSEAEGLKTRLANFYAYGLFSLYDSDKFSVFLGPLLGYCSGRILTLRDWSIADKPPFNSADVTVADLTYFEDSVSELLFGASLSLEWNLGTSFALALDTKMIYANPKVTNLGGRANLLQLQPTLGVQFTF